MYNKKVGQHNVTITLMNLAYSHINGSFQHYLNIRVSRGRNQIHYIINEEMFTMVSGSSLRFSHLCNNNLVKCFKSPIVVGSDSMDLQ